MASHPPLVGSSVLAAAGSMTWRVRVGNDVAPTSLNEGRRADVPVSVVVFYLGLKHHLVEAMVWYEQKGVRAAQCGSVPNAARWENVPFWEGA